MEVNNGIFAGFTGLVEPYILSKRRSFSKLKNNSLTKRLTPMDIATLTAFISPFLPFLRKLGSKAADKIEETAIEKFDGAAWTIAQSVWRKLSPKVMAKASAQEAINDVADHPEDEDFQAALRVQLKKLLEDDKALSEEIAQILRNTDPTLMTQTIQNITGDRNQVVNQMSGGQLFSNIDGPIIIVPDNFKLKDLNYLVGDDLFHEEILSHRHLTSINEYPVLAFVNDTFPDDLLNILGIEKMPFIYQNSVLESVENFKIGSGNLDLINSSYNASGFITISYTLNHGGHTFSGHNYRDSTDSSRKDNIDIFQQSQEDYENDTLRFDDEHQDFFYSPIDIPFQTEIENAEWTCISKRRDTDNLEGTIYQYPELGCLLSQGIRDSDSAVRHSDQWIQKIAKQNSKCRGFLLYQYSFISNLDDFFSACGMIGVSRQAPSPYLRFAHIRNNSNKPVKIENLQIRCLQSSPHHLTDITHRSRVLKEGKIINEEINIMLPSNQDLLIPIEFGFDTNSHLKYTSWLEDTTSPNWREDELQFLVAKPVSRENIDLITDLQHSSQARINEEYLGEWKNLSQDFMGQSKSIFELKNSAPKRFAIGTFFDIKSITFDGKELHISSPNDNSKVSISTYFAYGSCPYLVTFSRKGYWIEQGTILYGRQNERMKARERYAIEEETLRIKIEEREHEITFLEALNLIYLDQNTGDQHTVECLNSTVHKNIHKNKDGYYLLNKDEFIELNFSDLLPEKASKIQLEVIGYYEIIKS
jgi:hypothetical protein